MKNLILLLSVIIFTSFSANSQLVVKEAAKDTVVWQASKLSPVPKLIKFSLEAGDSYTMYYRNAKYSQITDIKYISIGDKETTIQFFKLCLSVLDDGKEYNIDLGTEKYNLSKSMGGVTIWSSLGYFALSRNNISSILSVLGG
jgi:hypothetical protein